MDLLGASGCHAHSPLRGGEGPQGPQDFALIASAVLAPLCALSWLGVWPRTGTEEKDERAGALP